MPSLPTLASYRRLFRALLFPALAFAPFVASAEVPKEDDLYQRAWSAINDEHYQEAAELFDQLIAARDDEENDYYNAACAYALAGNKDAAFDRLSSALQHGFSDEKTLQSDSDLKSLHGDPRWQTFVASVTEARAADPAARLLDLLRNTRAPSADLYMAAQKALRDGTRFSKETDWTLSQMYATVSTFAGDYISANAYYGNGGSKVDPVATGYTHARPALDTLLSLTKDRRAVFLNESHAQADTRAANFALLEPLRKQGFNYLALEGLGVKKNTTDGCQADVMTDEALQERGFPTRKTGYYTREPVFAEFVREAIRLGYRLYAYEAMQYDKAKIQTQAMREQGEADNLACLFARDPEAKVLLVAGFSHIAENPLLADDEQGWMAYRFKTKTGIDPLTIDTTMLLHRQFDGLKYSSKEDDRHTVGAYALANDAGELLGDSDKGFDVTLYIPPAVSRDATPNWLALGGARLGITVSDELCRGKRPCLIDAHKVEESDDAVASDRCVLHSPDETTCRLYLTPGSHRLQFMDETTTIIGEQTVLAMRGTEQVQP